MKILRWIAVLPAAILGLLLAYLFIGFTKNLTSFADTWLIKCFTGLFCGYLFVYAGTTIAPSHKTKTAFVLFLLICSLAILNWFLSGFTPNYQYSIITDLFAIIGAFVCYGKFKGYY